MKDKIVVRLHRDVYDHFSRKAKSIGLKTGAYISFLVEQEAIKAGFTPDFAFPDGVEYLFPTRNGHIKTASNQISVYLSNEAIKIIQQLKQSTGYVKNSEVIGGLLLCSLEGQALMNDLL